ncbi:MAG: Gfo/Idh/MocA family oxidoreductase [Patescibacteria group bacterium]
MNSKRQYTVAIIGAGRIAAFFDTPASTHILTHAHAITKNSRLKLVGFADTNVRAGREAAKVWKTSFFSSAKKLFTAAKPDIVVIATPDKTHVSLMVELSRLKPRLIICEKPVVTRKSDIAKLKKRRLPPVIVNYSRRFDPVVQKVAGEIKKGLWGKIIAARGIYTGSLLHNGSHLVDLGRFLLPNVTIQLTEGDAKAYSLFELDILTSKGRLRFIESGQKLMIERPHKDPLYRGFVTLGRASIQKTGLHDALPNLYRHAIAVLDGKKSASPNLTEALKTESEVL